MQWKRIIIITPRKMRKSARALANNLIFNLNIPTYIVSPKSKTYQPRWTDFIINWGLSKTPPYIAPPANNQHWAAAEAVNKLDTFKSLTDNKVATLEWSPVIEHAQAWLKEGKTVIARHTLVGHSGIGITIHNKGDTLPECPLYTVYKKKKHEYRVHVFDGEVIDITQKRKKKGALNLDTKIRNYHNGWVYCRSDLHIPDDLTELAIKAVEALRLQHGAVDIIWNEKENKCYVLEVNTAPGLVGTTLTAYVNAFTKAITK